MSIESVMPSNHLIFCCLLLLLPSIFSSIRVFSNKSALCIRWPKYWSFSVSLSSEYSGLVSFKIDWVWSPWSPRDSQTIRLSDYRTIIYPPLGPSLSISLLPLTAECLSRTCIQLKGTASLKVTMPLWGQHISNAWSMGWIQRSGSLTSMGTSLSGQPSSRAPMRPPEVSAARCIGTQFFPLPHSVSLTSSQILILQINLPTVHLHINLHFRICVPRN